MKTSALLSVMAVVLLLLLLLPGLSSCSSPTVPPAPNMAPIGDGLKVIGFALLGMSVVITVGRYFR